tara:strand:+ start:7364 stop:7699 length:336 start_codon:yes stop_codon:yes gene_type:complete
MPRNLTMPIVRRLAQRDMRGDEAIRNCAENRISLAGRRQLIAEGLALASQANTRHATPSSDGRRAMVLQFWLFNTTMGTSQTGFRSFDEAAPPLTGWGDGYAPCAAGTRNA